MIILRLHIIILKIYWKKKHIEDKITELDNTLNTLIKYYNTYNIPPNPLFINID